MKIAQAVDLYLTELEISQKSQAHISKTEWHLQKFVALHGSTEAGEVTRLCLARFVKGLRKENGEPYAPASLHGYVAALKGLFSYNDLYNSLAYPLTTTYPTTPLSAWYKRS